MKPLRFHIRVVEGLKLNNITDCQGLSHSAVNCGMGDWLAKKWIFYLDTACLGAD